MTRRVLDAEHRPSPGRLRRWILPALFLIVLYTVLRQRSWSVDGCLHTLDSDHFMDTRSYSHFLLRPVVFLWVQLCRSIGLQTHEQWYDALQLLFSGFGVIALTILFGVARRRGGEAAAWLCLVTIAFARNAMRQLVTLDEKGLGMITFALAVLASERCFRRAASRPGAGPDPNTVWLAALAWALAIFGHLQNAPYALAFLIALVRFVPEGGARRRVALAARAGFGMLMAGVVLFVALHWGIGGPAALPTFIHDLLVHRPAPAPATSHLEAARNALEGWSKAFFIVDRLSPRGFVGLAAVGFVVLALAALRGLARRRDALAGLLAVGGLFHMLLMPLANSYPGYGDSYTTLILAAFVLLATAPWQWLVPAAALVVLVDLPPSVASAYPPLSIQRQLSALIEIQKTRHAPWVIVDELAGNSGEQELAPAYYPMKTGLWFERCRFDSLPPGAFLLELPLMIRRDAAEGTRRVDTIQSELERRGRRVRRGLLWKPPRAVGPDFHTYGHYLIVEPDSSRAGTKGD